MRMGERTKRVLALLTAGAMVFTNTGMDVLASTSIVVGGITSGEDKKDETPAESESESETGTEQESESESETGSEAESEAAYTDQKVFTCEGDQATVTVTVPDEAQMPAGTELEVQPVVENSVTYDEIKNALTNEAQEVLGISAFHLAFITDGEAQIPSDIDYQVQIDYKDAVLAVAEGQEDSSVGAYVNQAGATADIQTSENGAVEAVSLSTKELGDVAVVRTGATAQERTYTYEDDEVIINVTVPAEVTLPQDAELVVKPVDEKTKEYKETVEKTEAEVEDYVLQHAVYDIGFQVNGEEVEPENGDIKVAFQFKQPVLNTEAITDGDADIDVKVLHVKDDGVEDTQANANVEADGSVKNVELVTDSFSPYDLVLLASELPEGNYGRVNFSYNDEKDAFRNSSYYVNTPLGLAGNFGVVAFDTANLTVDCNSNILAKKLIKVSNDWGTRHISGELSYVQEYKVSSTQPERSSNADNLSTLVVGSDVEVTGTIGQRFYMNGNTKEIETSKLNVIKDRNSKITPYIDLQKVEEEIKQISSTLAQQSNVGCTQKFIGEMNQRAITVTCGKGECAYYNTNLEELNERNSGGNPITIKGISNGASLVINIDCQSSSSNITIPAIDVEGASYQETTNFEYGRVILNLLNSAGKTITLSRAYASVIAPEATIIAKHSVNGSLIGRNVTTETENHRTTFTGTTTPAQAEVDGTKTVDGQTPTQEQKFTFVLEEKKGQEWGVVEEVQNEGKGITFKNLQYSKESDIGEHWYRVSEKVDKMSDYNTDTTQYIMKVTVTKTGDVYSAKKEYFEVTNPKTEEKQSVDKITFNNTTKKTELQIPVKKTAESDVWGNRTFEFELTAVDSAPMPEKNGSMVALSKPASGDTATGTFGKIEYKKTGIYQYKITEKAGNDSSVVYDNSEYIVTVEVKKNTDGELVASVTKIQKVKDGQTTDVAEVEFVNTEYTAAGSVTLEARKTLNGAAPGAGKFSFELKDKAGKVLQTKANDGKGKVTFDPISYKLEDAGKEFTYTVSEVIPTDEAGVTYDKSVYTVTVKVTDNGNGTLGTKVSYQKDGKLAEAISFANTYAASGSVSLEAGKTLNGAAPAAGKFSFELKDKAGKVLQTKANDGKGKVTFDPISYKLEDAGKEFTYTVSEVIPTDEAGVTYDKSVYTVTVKVTDNGNGTLGTKVSYQKGEEKVNGISFANTYAASGSVSLEAGKTLNGAAPAAGKFSFELKDKAGKVLQTKANDGKGKVTFDPISYKLEDAGKEFTYTVSEVIPTDEAGVTYDKSVYTVTVKVTDNGNGTLGTKVSYQKGEEKVNGISFANTYAASGSVSLEAGKTLNGAAPAAGKFSFELKDKAGKVLQTKANDGKGKVTFDPISYKLEDAGKEFTYTVSEVIPTDEAGVTYDKSVYTVTVKVTDNGNGTLGTKVSYQKGEEKVNGISFANTYAASGSVSLEASKTLNGAAPAAGKFSFELKDKAGKVLQTKANDGKGKVTFDPISYKLEDAGKEFTYTVSEVIPTDEAGVTYDKSVYAVTVKVTDNGNGTLGTKVSYQKGEEKVNGISFANTYAASGSVSLEASKTLNGAAPAAGKFSFELKDKAGKVLQTKANDGKGKVTFDPISYKLEDAGKEFTYTVSEVIPTDEAGVTYDKSVYTVTVKVTDNGNGTLGTKVSYQKGEEKVNGISFANTYAAAGSVSLEASKTLNGAAPAAGKFSFELKDKDRKVLQTKKNDGEGKVTFDPISYKLEDAGKEFTYTVSEVIPTDKAGVTYDESVYTVTVKVTDNGNGTLGTEVSYQKGEEKVNGISFANTYAAAGSVSLEASKTLNGAAPAARKFSFELKDKDRKVLQTKKNDGEGKVTFDPISYKLEDAGKEFTYTVSEVIPTDKAGVTYDESVYTVTVKVTDNGNGTLGTKVSYQKGEEKVNGISFANTYAASGSVSLEAGKTLNGAAPGAGKFSFELKDKAGKVLQTKANDGKGKVTFDPISYKLEDAGKEFTYTVSEVIPENKAGVTYDESVYTVTVRVTDNGNGTLGTEVSYQKGEEKAEVISFANTYSEEGTVNLKATKDFSGTTWKDETFQFVLTAGKAEGSEAASPMPEGTVDGSKTVTVTKDSKTAEFGNIVYVNNGTYNYQIHEVNDGQAGITYDGAVWNVQVIVSNGQNGVKNVAIQYKKSTDETYTPWNDANDAFAVTFHNTYAEKGTARIQVAKEFNADEYPTGDDAFTFTLKAAPNEEGTTESPLPEQTTVKVTDANAVSFGDITFDTNGTYNYTVEENAGMLPNVIYDKTVYDVQIKVEDGGKADGVKKITVMSKKQADKEYAPLDGTVFTAAFSNIRYAVNVKKTDLTGVNEVKGATLTVYKASDINEDGTVKENAEKVTEFVSDGGANDISEELIRGEAYVLVETSAPEGYAFTNNIPFTLNEDGTVTVDKELQAEDGTILVKDALIGEQKVPLTATKTLTGAALTGDDFSFTLEEVKEDGTTELLQTKTNDAAGKVAFDDLTYDYKAEGKTFTYVVKETDTQKTGITYSKEAYTVKVVISKADTEGKMTAEVSYTDATGKAADAMNFTNTFAGSVSLVKVGPQRQKLAGAKFMLYQQQPSTDYKAYAETEYVTDANGNIKVEGLPEGNYYFVETTAPDGYVIKMNDDGTAKQYPFTIQAGKAEATVGVDIDLGLIENDTITPGEGGDIDLGSVTIEKSVLNAAGKTITADGTTFYAGVFSKNQDGTYTLVKSATLEQNGKVTIKDLTVGTYYLFETTKQGDRINEADFAFEITGNGQEFQIKSDENTDVKLVNKEKETVESEEETEKESEVKTETKTKKTTTVKTGDTTPIALYVGLLAAAAVLIALIVFLRKRKNK